MKKLVTFLMIACMLLTELGLSGPAAMSPVYGSEEAAEDAAITREDGASAEEEAAPLNGDGPDGCCEMDGVKYASVGAALAAVPSEGTATVTMLTDTAESITIDDGRSITLNLDGFTVTGVASAERVITVASGAKLKLMDSSERETGKISGDTDGDGAGNIQGVYNGGTLRWKAAALKTAM